MINYVLKTARHSYEEKEINYVLKTARQLWGESEINCLLMLLDGWGELDLMISIVSIIVNHFIIMLQIVDISMPILVHIIDMFFVSQS